MLKILKIAAYLLAWIISLCALFYYGKDILSVFSQIKWGWVLILIVLQIPMIALGGLAFQTLCAGYHIQLRWQEWAGLSFIANLVNQLLPYRPGMAFRYWYLKKNYQMKVSQFIYLMVMYFLLMMGVTTFFALLGWFNSDLPHNFNQLALISFLIGSCLIVLLGWLKLKKPTPLSDPSENDQSAPIPFLQTLQKISNALHFLINHPRVFIQTIAVFIALNLVTTLVFYTTFMAIQYPLPFKHCLFLVGVLLAAMTLPITPGNIGVLETLFGTLTQMIYHDFSIGFSAIALYRTTQWIPSVLLGTTFSLFLVGSIIPSFDRIKFGVDPKVD